MRIIEGRGRWKISWIRMVLSSQNVFFFGSPFWFVFMCIPSLAIYVLVCRILETIEGIIFSCGEFVFPPASTRIHSFDRQVSRLEFLEVTHQAPLCRIDVHCLQSPKWSTRLVRTLSKARNGDGHLSTLLLILIG